MEWEANYGNTVPDSLIGFSTLGVHSVLSFSRSTKLISGVRDANKTGPNYISLPTLRTDVLNSDDRDAPLSKYGGTFEHYVGNNTGYFKTRKDSVTGVWNFVDPDGYLFFSMGINSVKFNSELQRELPSDLKDTIKANTLGGFSETDSINAGTKKMSHTPMLGILANFTQKNTARKRLYDTSRIYAIFDSAFVVHCDSLVQARITNEMITDKYLVGYFSDNEISGFTNGTLDRYTTVANYQDFGANDPTYIYARNWVKNRHNGNFTITSADRIAWNWEFADRYYRLCSTAIKSRDTNHLFIGSRLTENGIIDTGLYSRAGAYVDVVTVNLYHQWKPHMDTLDLWYEKSGKPFMLTEFYTKGMNTQGGNYDNDNEGAGFLVNTQQDRADFYEHFAMGGMSHKACIGLHWFQYIDSPLPGTSTTFSNKGIVDKNAAWYIPLKNSYTKIARDQYNLRNWLLGVKLRQQIVFNTLPTIIYRDTVFSAAAMSTSALPIRYSSSNDSVAKIINNKIQITGAGTALITAHQDGDNLYEAAESVTQELTVSKDNQVISFNMLADKFVLEPDFILTASVKSGLSISFSSSNSSIAAIAGDTVKIKGPGTVIITAMQSGNHQYNPAPSVSRSFNITDTIDLSPVADVYVRDGVYGNQNKNNDSILVIKNDTNTDWYRESFFRFDLTPLVGGIISSAKLKLRLKTTPNSMIVKAFPVADDTWSETGITYANSRLLAGTPSVASQLLNTTVVEMDMTTYMKQELSPGNHLAGFCIKDSIVDNDLVAEFYSRENAIPSNRPVLKIKVSRSIAGRMAGSKGSVSGVLQQTGEDNVSKGLRIFPNPAQQMITVSVDDKLYPGSTIRLFNTNGALMGTYQFNKNNYSINISKLPVGSYLIRVDSGNNRYSMKMIKIM